MQAPLLLVCNHTLTPHNRWRSASECIDALDFTEGTLPQVLYPGRLVFALYCTCCTRRLLAIHSPMTMVGGSVKS